jgi:magnesium transporter
MMKKYMNDFLDPHHVDDLRNPDHPSIYIDHQDYLLLILRFPFVNERNEIGIMSKGFIFYEEEIYAYDAKAQNLKKLEDSWQSLYLLLDEIIDKTLELANRMHEEVIDIEERLYSQEVPKDLLSNWFNQRSNLVRMNRVVARTIETYEKFYTKNKQKFDEFIHSYHDLFEHLTRSQRYIEHDIEKLNSIYSFYSATNNDKMNRYIYMLTIISAIFLPLNLIVGFFGMNTGTLPFTDNGGTFKVMLLLVSISVVTALFLLLKKHK